MFCSLMIYIKPSLQISLEFRTWMLFLLSKRYRRRFHNALLFWHVFFFFLSWTSFVVARGFDKKLAFEASCLRHDMAGWCISRKHKQTVNSCVCVCEGGVLFYWKHISGSRWTLYACVRADLSRKASCIWQRLCFSPDVCPLVSPCVLSCGITGEIPLKHWFIHTTAQTDCVYSPYCFTPQCHHLCVFLNKRLSGLVLLFHLWTPCLCSHVSFSIIMNIVSDHQSSEMW